MKVIFQGPVLVVVRTQRGGKESAREGVSQAVVVSRHLQPDPVYFVLIILFLSKCRGRCFMNISEPRKEISGFLMYVTTSKA